MGDSRKNWCKSGWVTSEGIGTNQDGWLLKEYVHILKGDSKRDWDKSRWVTLKGIGTNQDG